MTLYQSFIQHTKLRRVTVLLLLLLLFYLFRSMLSLFLLTFIFTFLAYKTIRKLRKFVPISSFILTIILYGLVVCMAYFALTKYVPMLINQTIQMVNSVVDFYEQTPAESNDFYLFIQKYIEQFNILGQLQKSATLILAYIQNFGKLATAIVMSFILSFFFLIEEKKTWHFSRLFLKGELAWFFEDMRYFAHKFANTFGVVIEAQFLIAIINTTLTIISLSLMGFTQLPSLAIMIFVLSLIPVAGVIVSIIPLSFIAYSQGGLHDVILVLVIVVVIHLIEAYLLNPKLMSSKTELPIFYTFVVLLISEHYFGTWGLVMGVPVFVFLLDLLKVKPITQD
ncbi:AI-2E family transporter [Enterococcus bulliens]|uniref:AI-2E family transporter n=1 Tax=uncultured Enterococcus sp. TaxID=167972 RepID=UPI0025EBE6E0|nr:AI-2E family transporter [uncultured Enterococcus sp.]